MIARLTGRCIHADADSLVIDVAGVGYLVRATRSVIHEAVQATDDVSVHIHTSVREDAIQLYGFANVAEQQVFERLIALQGVGPKVAVSVLSALSPQDLHRATVVDDVALLQSVPGVGPKVARRIVTELRDKLTDIVPAGTTTLTADVRDADMGTPQDSMTSHYEAREALMGLGMSLVEAEAALQDTSDSADAGERVKQALAARAARVRS